MWVDTGNRTRDAPEVNSSYMQPVTQVRDLQNHRLPMQRLASTVESIRGEMFHMKLAHGEANWESDLGV
jgi:hypothetical protein